MTEPAPRYHHGDLPRAIVSAALEEITSVGPGRLSLRAVARRAGVSHAAPTHHFADKAGVLTAVAAEGWAMLAEETAAPADTGGSVVEVGRAYLRFALTHPAHFAVMFRPELYRPDDDAVVAARDRAGEVLFGVVGTAMGPSASAEEVWSAVVASWSMAHGFATLWVSGNFYPEVGPDPEAALASAARAFVAVMTPRS
jgi:AcrR family transcriptional regulator